MNFITTLTYLILFLSCCIIHAAEAISSSSSSSSSSSDASVTIQLQRPRQFLMDIYTRSFRKGLVQHMRLDNGASRPCWNLASRHVGSISVNDPYVKVTFYRSIDCLGSSSTTIQGSETIPGKRHSILKARSVSVTKMRPILLLNSSNENQHQKVRIS